MVTKILWLLIVLLLTNAVQSSEYFDSFFDDDPEIEAELDILEDGDLKNYKSLITRLYGNESIASSSFWDKLDNAICNFQRLWIIEDFKSTLSENESALTEGEVNILLEAADNYLDTAILTETDEDYCGQLSAAMNTSRSYLDCAIGQAEVSAMFRDTFGLGKTGCTDATLSIWDELLRKGDVDRECNSTLVFGDLIRIAKSAQEPEKYGKPVRSDQMRNYSQQLSARLIATISSPKHIEYLTRSSCGEIRNARDCIDITGAVTGIVCNDFSIRSVLDVEELVKSSLSTPFKSLEESELAMNILEEVTETVYLMSQNPLSVQPRSAAMSISSLETYVDIMDNTIGTSSKQIWSPLSENETMSQLTRVLSNNDKYIWGMSNIFYSSPGHEFSRRKVEGESMSLQLHRSSRRESAENVAFLFDDADIQTKFEDGEIQKELSVYAIHYESLADLLQGKGLNVNDSTTNTSKQFVGKGGIISLSAHEQNDKVSIPVSYRMNFLRSAGNVQSEKTTSVCLSCEYLDLETGRWMDNGCSVKGVDDGGVTCDCNHTTNFAAFMSPVEVTYEMTPGQYKAKQITSYVGSALSVLALTLCLIIFNLVKPSLRNDRVKAHISLTFALLIVHMTQLASDFVINIDTACLISAVVTHYFLLAAFFWMLIEGIFLYLYVVQVFVHSSIEYLRLIYVLGWTIPGIIVLISAAIGIPTDTYLEMNEQATICGESQALYPPLPGSDNKFKRCWLSTTSGMAYSFIVPASIIIIVNSVVLGKVFQVLVRVSNRNRSQHRPFSPATSTTGHSNRAFTKKDHDAKSKKNSFSPNKKGSKDVESSYGATSPITDKAKSKDEIEPNGNSSLTSSERKTSPQHYMNNPSYPQKRSPTYENESINNKKFIAEIRTALKGALVLLPILGIPWIFGLWAASNYILTMIFIVLNSTQGIFIFVIYCLLNGEIMRALRRQVKVAKLRSSSGRSRVSSTSSTKSLNSKFTLNWRAKSAPDK